MSAKQYVDLPGITVYDEEIKGYIDEKRPELTYAEYQALPSSKLTDGKEYYITDASVTGIDINDSVVSPNSGWSSQKINSELPVWSNEVTCVTGDTSVTIVDSAITTSSIVEPFCNLTKPMGYNSITITNGQVVLAFDALTSSVTFTVKITNRSTFSV